MLFSHKLKCTSVFKEIDAVNELLNAADAKTVDAESTIEDIETTLETYRDQIAFLQNDIEKCKTDNQMVRCYTCFFKGVRTDLLR